MNIYKQELLDLEREIWKYEEEDSWDFSQERPNLPLSSDYHRFGW